MLIKDTTAQPLAILLTLVLAAAPAWGNGFIVQRVASGLDSPTYVTQAPGDNSSLYITELGGAIKKLDLTSGAISTVATVGASNHWTTGLHTMAFHPDFESNGKFYVARGLDPYDSFTKFVNRVDEFTIDGGGNVAFSRNFLEAEHSSLVNGSHAIDWVGFDTSDPNSDTLYATIGDGYINNSRPDDSPFAKMLAFDTSDPDPNWQLHHKGLRNPWRASFDRETGDLYIGDVGFRTAEEINFAAAGTSGIDFGWADREGTGPGTANGPKGDSIYPVFEGLRTEGYVTIVGGYMYRGPVSELQGRYFYSDTIAHEIWSAEFDTSTDPNTFDGTQFTDIVEHKAQFDDLVPGGADINYIVSFGEDNSGNLYIIDYGDNFEPTPGSGEIYVIKQASADFDEDGDIDGEDFLTWQANDDFGQDELAVWEVQYGWQVAPSSLAVVPEPTSLGLLLIGSFAIALRSRQQR